MRRGRRGQFVHEFGGSGEDSFVAVVVTKLTGALLFILLLTMVIMALIPRGEAARSESSSDRPLRITTPEMLPEAIAGRSYTVAFAATGGGGLRRWRLHGTPPEGLTFDAEQGRLQGTPRRGTPQPVVLTVSVSDGRDRASLATRLLVYQPERPLRAPSRWKPSLPPVPWRAWMQQGFGFLVLLLVHLTGMGTLSRLERLNAGDGPPVRRRFVLYRSVIRLASLAAAAGLAAWLVRQRGG